MFHLQSRCLPFLGNEESLLIKVHLVCVWSDITFVMRNVKVACYIFLVLSKEVGVGEGRVISVDFFL